ncbi:hypothetical protein KY290_004286 [Solanum tuberosum]|uniref:16S rRNA (uracil(1498)-N(3))-methyltransferase n=1 Tax=Solanum tuberosum TaxID=4113 RepID=A0ABQ7WVB0_SOLTU|nr:hypothetical protein KY290_004286 [Solanum tuberosum]
MESEVALSNRRDANPVAVVEALIQINNQLHQHEATVGILTYAQQHLGVQLKESRRSLWNMMRDPPSYRYPSAGCSSGEVSIMSSSSQCQAFAKALHYKETESEGALKNRRDANPVAVVEALIHINNPLHQHEAAVGILTYAQQHLGVQLKKSWYEKLQCWDDALKAYTAKASQASRPHLGLDATLGRIQCLAALARWEELNNLCKEYWTPAEPAARLEMAPMAANAAWNMGEWDQMAAYVSRLDDGDETKLRVLGYTASSSDGSTNGTLLRAVLLVRQGSTMKHVNMLKVHGNVWQPSLLHWFLEPLNVLTATWFAFGQLSVLEEVIEYCTLPPMGNPVADLQYFLQVWQALLAVRALVLPPTEDIDTWIKFASLCRKNGRISQARSTLIKLLQVMLAYLKYQWSLGEDHKRKEAFARLQDLAMDLSRTATLQPVMQNALVASSGEPLVACMYLRLGTWKWVLSPGLDGDSIQEILSAFRNSAHCATKWGKAWHTRALFNTAVMSHYTLRCFANIAAQFIVAAITGYFHSIACGAHAKGVDDSLQIIRRIHSNNHAVRELIQSLLVRIGQSLPEAPYVSTSCGIIVAYSLIRNRVDRLRRVNFAAAKQCQWLHEMVLNPPIKVGGLLPLVKNSKLSFIATAEAKPESSALNHLKKSVVQDSDDECKEFVYARTFLQSRSSHLWELLCTIQSLFYDDLASRVVVLLLSLMGAPVQSCKPKLHRERERELNVILEAGATTVGLGPHCLQIETATDGIVRVKGDEFWHMTRVLRLTIHDRVELFDGKGGLVEGCIQNIDQNGLDIVALENPKSVSPHSTQWHVFAAFGTLKGGRADWLVEKCTELGACCVTPLLTDRSLSISENRVDRLQRVSFAAAKQCQRLHEMVLNPPIKIGGLLPLVKNSKLSFIATAEAKPLFSALSSIKKESAGLMIIGPEGDFTERELNVILEAGATSVGLGPHRLRVETATVALLSALMLWCDDQELLKV